MLFFITAVLGLSPLNKGPSSLESVDPGEKTEPLIPATGVSVIVMGRLRLRMFLVSNVLKG